MTVASGPNGSVVISPHDPDNQIIVTGDPASGTVEVIEAHRSRRPNSKLPPTSGEVRDNGLFVSHQRPEGK
jgi:hypothetical protein